MDKLTLADQQKVRKMSDERLWAKLIEAGYGKDDYCWPLNFFFYLSGSLLGLDPPLTE